MTCACTAHAMSSRCHATTCDRRATACHVSRLDACARSSAAVGSITSWGPEAIRFGVHHHLALDDLVPLGEGPAPAAAAVLIPARQVRVVRVSEPARSRRRELVEPGGQVSGADVAEALAQLESLGLLRTALIVRDGDHLEVSSADGLSRREMIRRVAFAGAGAAVGTSLVTTIMPPSARAAGSGSPLAARATAAYVRRTRAAPAPVSARVPSARRAPRGAAWTAPARARTTAKRVSRVGGDPWRQDSRSADND